MALWFKIIRPGTLMAFFSPIGIGLLVSAKEVQLNWWIAVVTLLTAGAIQSFYSPSCCLQS